jgi:hypothetical protein
MNKLQLNFMGPGSWPLDYCSRLLRVASGVMYSIAVDDRVGTETGLCELEKTISDLRKSITKTTDE